MKRKKPQFTFSLFVLALLLLVGCLGGESGPKYYDIAGLVIDEATEATLPNVDVVIDDNTKGKTNERGQYVLKQIEKGEVTITIDHNAYEAFSQTIKLSKNLVNQTFALTSPAPIYDLADFHLELNGQEIKDGNSISENRIRLKGNLSDFDPKTPPSEGEYHISLFQVIVNGKGRDVLWDQAGDFDTELKLEQGENLIQLQLMAYEIADQDTAFARTGPTKRIVVK